MSTLPLLIDQWSHLAAVTPTPSPSESSAGAELVVNLPDDSAPGIKIGTGTILLMSLGIVCATLLAVVIWRAMQRPRLKLTFDEEKQRWTTTRRDLLQYVISIPLLILLWSNYFFVILWLAPNKLTAGGLLVVSSGIVISIRFLAHVWREAAHNLAKIVPLTLVTAILLNLAVRPAEDLLKVIDDRQDLSLPATLTMLFIDYVFTAIWFYVGVRRRAMSGHKVPGIPWHRFPEAVALRTPSKKKSAL